MARKLTREDYIAFAEAYNDINRYPDYVTLGIHLDITKVAILRRASTYRRMREEDPKLPTLIDREEEHERQIEQMFKWPKTDLKGIGGPGRYVVTSAQLGARVNEDTLESLKVYCKKNKAKLIVMVIRYGPSFKKVTRKSDPNYGEYVQIAHLSARITNDPDITVVWPDVDLAMLNDNVGLNTIGLVPTLDDLVGNMGSVGDTVSHLIAAPVMRLEAVAVSNNALPKVNMTTGAVTFPRYRDGKAPRKAIKNHCFGGIVVEVENDEIFHYRQLLSNKEGEFYDIDLNKYTPTGYKFDPSAVEALVTGDWHTGYTDPTVREVTFGKGGIAARLKPRYIIMHDFTDSYSISHHDAKDSVIMARKARDGKFSLKQELQQNQDEVRFILKSTARIKSQIVFAASNHPEHIDRWLGDNNRWPKDPHNSIMGAQLYYLKGSQSDSKQLGMTWYFKEVLKPHELRRLTFLTRDDDFVRPEIPGHGIKLDMHGDEGLNGSRGSIAQFKRLGFRTFTGHSHAPAIWGSAWRVGTSSLLDLGYNDGPSNWMHTHGIVFKNGQRMLINIVEGNWHG
jgi:hypothetical protein